MKLLTIVGLTLCVVLASGKPAKKHFMEKSSTISHSGSALVTVKSLESRKTKSGDASLPDHLPVEVTSSDGRLSLLLTKNKRLNLNRVNVKFGSGKKYNKRNMDIAFYRDQRSGAAITVKSRNGKHYFEGTLLSGGKRYALQPAEKSSFKDKSLSLLQALESINFGLHTLKEEDLNIQFGQFEEPKKETFQDHLNKGGAPHVDPQQLNDTNTAENLKVTINNKKRTKRAARGSKSNFHVEIVMVIDYTVYSKFMEMNSNDATAAEDEIMEYFGHQANGISLAYDSIEATYGSVSISTWLKDIHILDTEASSSLTYGATTPENGSPSDWDEYTLDTTYFFNNIWTWKKANGYTWYNPDHLMVFTMFDVKGDSTIGVAPLGSVCRGSNSWGGVSINEDIGLHAWALASHEMGHNLGTGHDGEGNTCSSSDQFIMAPWLGTLQDATASNAYTFSSCSITQMIDNLAGTADGYPKVCTFNTICDDGEPLSLTETLAGQLYDEDEQCNFHLGGNHYYDDGFCMHGDDDICKELRCRSGPNEGWCRWLYPAADGTPCGNGKWCRYGSCIDIGTGRDVSDQTCSIFDHPEVPADCEDTENYQFRINYSGVLIEPTCAEVIDSNPEWCFLFESSLGVECDKSCQTYGLNWDGAECNAPDAPRGCSGDIPGTTFNGWVTCSEAATNGWCVYDVVVDSCCASCGL